MLQSMGLQTVGQNLVTEQQYSTFSQNLKESTIKGISQRPQLLLYKVSVKETLCKKPILIGKIHYN